MTAYHYWQNQPGCSPNDIPTLPTRARHVSWLRQGLTPNIAPTTTLSQVMAGRDFYCIQGLPTPPTTIQSHMHLHTCITSAVGEAPCPSLLTAAQPNTPKAPAQPPYTSERQQ
jgi:hypothetical protein